MPEERASEDWDAARYQRERRSFIERRLLLRPVTLHAGLIFGVTGFAGWLASKLLLALGMRNMPLRYALAFLLSYLVFALAVRVWSDFMRAERDGASGWGGGFLQGADGGEGCLMVLAFLLAGLLLAAVFALFGGGSLLLEVAFEVVFAGVVVRRLGRRETVGDWSGRLLRNTWLPATVAALVLVTAAGWLQHEVPAARTLGEAVRALWPK